MKKSTLIAIAAALTAIASELGVTGATNAADNDTDDTPETPAAPTSGRGSRGPRAAKPKEEVEAPAGKTVEELKAIIKPLIDDARGEEVKKLIAKHGGTKLADLPPEAHEAFIKDIDAISY